MRVVLGQAKVMAQNRLLQNAKGEQLHCRVSGGNSAHMSGDVVPHMLGVMASINDHCIGTRENWPGNYVRVDSREGVEDRRF